MRQGSNETTYRQMQRVYLMGLRRARAKAQREMDEMADRFEEILWNSCRDARRPRGELGRLRTFDDAILAERDPTMRLN